MPLRPQPYREVRRKLLAAGFSETSQRGSHVKFFKAGRGEVRTVIVPRRRVVPLGTLRSIVRQAGLTPADFDAL